MPTLTLPIKPHANQHDIIHSPYRFNVIAAGRRFGKTESQKLRAIYMVMEGAHVWWVNPTFDNTYEAWLDFLSFFEQFTARENINKSRRQIFAPTGGSIRMLGADNFKRGPGVNHLFIDEAAFINLGELWHYQLRPMLLDTPNGGATFLSSTNGRNGFWQLYQRGLDPEESDWKPWHYTSYDNPLLDIAEIEDIKRNTPQRVFQQEYMAEFLDDGGAVFRNLKACIIDERPEYSGQCVFGVDWARHHDYTVITALDANNKQVLEIDRFNQIDWTLQRGRLTAMYERWKPYSIIAESNSIGEPNIEELKKQELPITGFQTTAASKAGLINSLALAFEQQDIIIPDNPTLLGELQAYTVERLPSGNFRYTAPSGLHDDMVISLALAWHGVNQGQDQMVSVN
jgi:hypothetical protein